MTFARSKGATTTVLLEIRDIALTRGRRPVLRGVSMHVAAGEIVALIGPNGAGKTTLLEVIVGARHADRGEVLGQGRALGSLAERGRLMSWVADDAVPPAELSVRRVLEQAAARGEGGAVRLGALTDALSLEPLLELHAGRLSRGEQKRVSLAEALVLGRPLAVLDEPFAAFDPLKLREALALIRALAQAGSAFLVSVHQIEQAVRVADRCVVLSEGSVLAVGNEAELREAAGVPEGELDEVVVALLRRARSGDAA